MGKGTQLAMFTLQEGRITFFHLFTLAIMLVVLFNALKFLPPLRDYYALKRAMQQAIDQASTLRDEDLIREVVAQAKNLHIKLDRRDVEVTHTAAGTKHLQVEYEVTVTFPFRFYRKLTFSPEVVSSR